MNNDTSNQNNNIGFRCASDDIKCNLIVPDERQAFTDSCSGSTLSQVLLPFLIYSGKNIIPVSPYSVLVDGVRGKWGEKNMFENVCSFEKLMEAYYRTCRGKRDRSNVSLYEFFLENNLLNLQYLLRSGEYYPSVYTRFTIFDPKTRLVSAPAFCDRVLHHSLVKAIEPAFEKRFIYDSYACRKNRGTHFGAKRVKKFLMATRCIHGKDKDIYILQCDIQKYFQSIDWEILLSILSKTIKCEKTMDLIYKIITVHESPVDNIPPEKEQLNLFTEPNEKQPAVSLSEKKGLPIGNLTSQLFANVYLNELDHFVKDQLGERWYARYMDDFLVIHPDKEHLFEVRDRIKSFINDKLKLSLHPKKLTIKNVKYGVPFVGYRIFYDHKLIRGSTLLRIEKKYRKRVKSYEKSKLSKALFLSSQASVNGHLKHADTYNLRSYLMKN